MAKESPKSGTYVLTGARWRRRHEDGSYTIYNRGDEVELNEREAARLVGGRISSFRPAQKESSSRSTETPSTPSTQSSSSSSSQKQGQS